jgi:DNA-directed RNA polymerase sigma subunit (sigma70/sigma32)
MTDMTRREIRLASCPGETSAASDVTKGQVFEMEARQHVRGSVFGTIGSLSAREHFILENRLMAATPKTPAELGERFQVSPERIRQVEGNVIRKIRAALADEGGVASTTLGINGVPVVAAQRLQA